MKLSASIMAHPDRSALVADLRERLTGAGEIPVYWDDEGPASGNADRVWRTARGGWGLADPEADWHVLIQDDAVPCADFLPGLAHALLEVPDDATVCPYLGQGGAASKRWGLLGAQADQRGASFVRASSLMWGVAICLPTRLIPEMIESADRMHRVPDDMRVAGWTKKRRGEVWYTWPSLVDHRPVPSITKHRAADRRAVRHHQGSALEIDWSGPVVSDPAFTRTRGPRSGPSVNRQVTSRQRRFAPER